MQLLFTKMQGLGNDFIVINALKNAFSLAPERIQKLADRHTGVGFDQLLVVEPPSVPEAEFNYRIFNADGREVEQCGNGARCFARYVTEKKLTSSRDIPVKTNTGLITLRCLDNGWVLVDMGLPILTPERIPFIADEQAVSYRIRVDSQTLDVSAVSMGNPHVVLTVEDVESAPLETLGPVLESHVRFPQRVNVGFMQIVSSEQIKLRVYERGVGETRACGSGACAAVVAGRLQGRLNDTVNVDLIGGRLVITWPGRSTPVTMTGPAEFVYEGSIEL
ncbi:MAG: diaminopimelate epimerase [Gammaproteobacteria bacterium]|nr:diaminopimelate epimerase [Gammaproteobacteria bacterium]